MNNNSLNIGFIGFGLIAGSIAKAIKAAHPDCRITALSRSDKPLIMAKNEGVIDNAVDCINDNFSECDFIFLCTPVLTITAYLGELKGKIKKTCILTDVGSVKTSIHEAVCELSLEANFIGGHPMAGSERSGYANSDAAILKGAKYVITPTSATTDEQLNRYKALVKDINAIPIVMNCKTHDISVAGISHLPHLISAALAKTVMDNDDENGHMHLLAANGFKDTTRIAASSPEMWSQICSTNDDAICIMLDKYIAQLTEIRDAVTANKTNPKESADYIEKLFSDVRTYRETF